MGFHYFLQLGKLQHVFTLRYDFAVTLDTAWASHWVHFAEEGILVHLDNNNSGSNSYRLFHSRSRSSEYYWATPRGAISRDGKYVVYDSNFDIFSHKPARSLSA